MNWKCLKEMESMKKKLGSMPKKEKCWPILKPMQSLKEAKEAIYLQT